MKALPRKSAGILTAVLLSAGALGVGLLSWGRLDLISSEQFESWMVFSRVVGAAASLILLYPPAKSPGPKPVLIPVRV
jgi:hypothetical protein